jgi:Spy/CpxP family protein refolding chaperone
MTKTKILLLVAFVAVFFAGLTIGLFAGRNCPPRHGPPWLAAELELSPDQVEKMKEIWSKIDPPDPHLGEMARQDLASQRDEAIKKLLGPDQISSFERIIREYESKREERQLEMMAPLDEAFARTREILTEEQLKKFEELEKRMRERGHRRGGPRFGPRDGPEDGERAEKKP